MSILSGFLHQVAPKDGWGTAFVTAGLGAFVGGWVASRAFTKRAVVNELNGLSAALTLCFAATNRFTALKSQHVKGLKQQFDQVAQDHAKFLQRPRQSRGQFVFRADFQTLTPVMVPIDELKKTIFEKTSIRGRALVAVVDLASSIESLHRVIKDRTALSDEIRNRPNKTDQELLELYLGRKNSAGHVDERYRANVDAIYSQTDDCIFFSRVLASDLIRYGNSLRRQYMWRYWLCLPKMIDGDWSKARAVGLIPDDANYEKWLSGFRKLTKWERLKLILLP